MDPAFNGAGSQPGFELWRIEALKPVKIAEVSQDFRPVEDLLRPRSSPDPRTYGGRCGPFGGILLRRALTPLPPSL